MTVANNTAAFLVLLAAVLGALTVIVKFTVRWTRAIIRFGQRIEKALVNVEAQLYPNGGASLRDAVNRLQAAIGVQDIPSRGKGGDQLAAASAPTTARTPGRQPPSTLLARLDELGTRTQADVRTEAMEARLLGGNTNGDDQ